MTDATRYKETVCWRTICNNVSLLSLATPTDVATFRLTVAPVDLTEAGAMLAEKEIGYVLVDDIGSIYTIIGKTSTTIDVADIFRTNMCPVSSRPAYICKTVWGGRSPLLSPAKFRFLNPIAVYSINQYNLDILWSNDPNAKRIGFVSTSQPTIADYSADITCMDGVVINPERDYGQDPILSVWEETEAGKHSRLPVDPQITRVDGLITSILWSGTGELISGYILISK